MPAATKSFTFAASLLLAATLAQAQNNGTVADVVYGHKAGMALTFDAFVPVTPNGAGILFMVSEGWVSGWSPPEQARENWAFLLDRGFTVFMVRHGSSPRFKVPEAHADVKRALRYISLHAVDFGVDHNRLGAFGGSEGGHLSLMLGLDTDEGDPTAEDEILRGAAKLAAVVAYFPLADLRPWVGPSARFPALDFADSLAASVSPILFVSSDDPPVLLIHGDADRLVPIRNSEVMHAALLEAGVTTDFITITGAGHGFRDADAERARVALVAWFETHLIGN